MAHWQPELYTKSERMRIQDAICTLKLFDIDTTKYNNILDIGCGNGAVTKYLVEHVFNKKVSITAIDANINMINHATQSNQHQRINYQLCDICNIKFSAQFDLAISFVSLHWIDKQKTALLNINQSLLSEGHFIALMYPRMGILHELINDVSMKEKWKAHFRDFDNPLISINRGQYIELLKKCGFNRININQDTVYPLKSRKAIYEVTKSWLPHLQCLPKTLHEPFLQEITMELPFPLPVDRVILHARKN